MQLHFGVGSVGGRVWYTQTRVAIFLIETKKNISTEIWTVALWVIVYLCTNALHILDARNKEKRRHALGYLISHG